MAYSLDAARQYWRFPPSKAYGKKDTAEYCRESDAFIKDLIERETRIRDERQQMADSKARITRWLEERRVQSMMDFGCGLGQDGLHFARALGLRVTFADIVPSNAALTARFANIWNVDTRAVEISDNPETFDFTETFDVVYSCGVLHHSPVAKAIVRNLARFLNPNGLFVVMLYTASHFARTGAATLDEYAVKSEAPAPIEVTNPYSDFYDVPKAVSLFEGFDLLDHWAGYKELFGWYVFGRRAVSV